MHSVPMRVNFQYEIPCEDLLKGKLPDFHYNKFIKFAEKKYAQQNKLLLLDLVFFYKFDDVFTEISVKTMKVYIKKNLF